MSRCATLLVCSLLLAACGGSSSNEPAKTTIVFGGVFAGENGTESGRLTANVVVEDSSGTGSFVVNGSTKAFSSISYDGTSIVATGSGFVFTGTADDSTISGGYTSPTGGGLFTGLRKVGGTAPTTYCGTHIGSKNGVPVAGPFTFVQRGDTRLGVFTSALGDPFRGVIHAANSTGPVTLDTLIGSAAVAVSGGNFAGAFLMAGGDSGAVAGSTCPTSVGTSLGAIMQGVLGSFDGSELGDFSFNLSSTGVGSTGSYRVGGLARNFVAVISGVGNQVAAFDTTFRVIATLNTDTLEGSFKNQGTGLGGSIAGLNLHGAGFDAFCGVQQGGGLGSGVFSFLALSDSTIFGLYTGGSATDPFQGLVTGNSGNDAALMEGQPVPMTVLPAAGGFGGVFDFTASGGPNGTVTGGLCP
jgi:hypothetical protein